MPMTKDLLADLVMPTPAPAVLLIESLYDGDLPEDTLLPLCAKYGLLL